MKLLQNIQTGETSIVESPAPKVGKNSVLISSNIHWFRWEQRNGY